ncbi:hypothetical protein ANRL1_01500 [Anaerolineae bacterium]|nr:hypothetical protein ANRL1_01500 [Anaerolineae bacterium]
MSFQTASETDFTRARLKAFWRELFAMIARRPNELLSFDEVKRSLKVFGQNYRGVQTVPVAQIIGSATLRYHDFDRAFLPTQGYTKHRWRRVDEAYYEDVNLPPVQLYQVGEVYFVRDGHHRVSVARERGQEFIEAEVIEVKTRVPLTADLTAHDLEIVGEYANFLEQTRIDKLRPAHAIQFSEPGGYARLIEHIAVHRYFLGVEADHPIKWANAVVSWYDHVYMPVVNTIREHTILKDFPRRTEADLYLWITDHHYYLNEQGEEIDFAQAAIDFARNYSERVDKKLLRGVKQAVTDFLEGNGMLPVEGTMVSEPHRSEEPDHEK